MSFRAQRQLLETPPDSRAKLAEEFAIQLDAARQALWNIYGILGFDQDGDDTPDALSYPTVEELVTRAAKESRGLS